MEEVWRRHVVTAANNEYSQSKLYSFRNPQPVEVPEKMCDVVTASLPESYSLTWQLLLLLFYYPFREKTLELSSMVLPAT